jgi:hypothetical protein
VLSGSATFLNFWLTENCRSAFLRHVDRQTLPALRLVCHNFASAASPHLFREICVTFKASSFSKPGRMSVLRRVGKHARTLTFRVPHSAESFLPPLLHPMTGEQLAFNYVPQLDAPAKSKEPKYGSWEMTDLLIRQYPPIFHAATNIPSFIRAFSAMPGLEHVSIHSPDQNMVSRYRKSAADYTLVSLRIAMERAPLAALSSISLHGIHPSALLNLQPVLSYGSSPNSCRRWTQIRKLAMELDSTPFTYSNSDDHVRVVQAYMRAFATSLTHLAFTWTGAAKGPSPLTSDHSLSRALELQPYPARGARPTSPKPLRFFNLQYMTLENAAMDTEQVAAFITQHRKTLIEFSFEDVSLRNGDWESTLEPLRALKRAEMRRRAGSGGGGRREDRSPHGLYGALDRRCVVSSDIMDVPCMLSPYDLPPEPVIEGTLEPQVEEPVGGWQRLGANLGVKRWFGKGRHERKVSDHWRRVLNGSIFPWR